MAAGVIVAAIAARRLRIVRAFRDAGAIAEAHARTLDELGVRDAAMVRTLEREGVVVAAGPRYYLDVARFEEGQRRGTQMAIAIVVAFIAIVLVLVLTRPR